MPNPGQADADHDGIGNVIDGAMIDDTGDDLSRNVAGMISATLCERRRRPDRRPGRRVRVRRGRRRHARDLHGDHRRRRRGDGDRHADAAGRAGRVHRDWDGGRGVTAEDTGDVEARRHDAGARASTRRRARSPTAVTVAATLRDSDGAPLEGRTVDAVDRHGPATATTERRRRRVATLTLAGPAGATDADGRVRRRRAARVVQRSAAFTVLQENTSVTIARPGDGEEHDDGAGDADARPTAPPLAGRTLVFFAEVKKGKTLVFEQFATAPTNSNGVATITVPASRRSARKRIDFAGDTSFLSSTALQVRFISQGRERRPRAPGTAVTGSPASTLNHPEGV